MDFHVFLVCSIEDKAGNTVAVICTLGSSAWEHALFQVPPIMRKDIPPEYGAILNKDGYSHESTATGSAAGIQAWENGILPDMHLGVGKGWRWGMEGK